jgi:hypothetical protein
VPDGSAIVALAEALIDRREIFSELPLADQVHELAVKIASARENRTIAFLLFVSVLSAFLCWRPCCT